MCSQTINEKAMILVPLLLLVSIFLSRSTELFAPTDAEIRRAIQLQTPREGWGYQARQENEVRLFIIGGSNTIANTYYGPLSKLITNSSLHSSWNGTIDKLAISGCSPQDFIGMKYKFEFLPKHQWPNMIMLEFAVNTMWVDYPTAAHSLDSTIRTFKFKYHHAQLPEPDFFMFELFGVENRIKDSKSLISLDISEKLKRLSDHKLELIRTAGAFTGCPACPELRKVSDFYDYPVVTWHYPGFRAFLRWYLTPNQSFVTNPWNFTIDGQHVSDFGGQYVVDKLFAPFFRDAMATRVELPAHQRIGLPRELRMFPPVTRPYQVMSHVIWDRDPVIGLRAKIRQPMEWNLINREDIDGYYHGNECIGSNVLNSVLNVDFEVPTECDHLTNCKVSIGFVKSWNVDKYGNVTCGLLDLSTNKVLVSMDVLTKIGEIDHTGVMQSTFPLIVPPGKYTTQCKKIDDRLSCLATLLVVAEVML